MFINDGVFNNHVKDTKKHIPFVATSNSGNTYSVQIDNLDYLEDGQPLMIKFNAASTGAISLSVNGGTAKSVVDYFNNPVTNVRKGLIANLAYSADDSNFQLQGKGGDGDAFDIEARREILDIKLKLDENEVINFISKTGIGFFDLFSDTSNIDTTNSTASIVNTDAIFTGQQLLKFLTQNFDTFKSLELNLYDLERQSINVDADVNNSNTIEATVSPDSIATGDKFYLNGEIYTVNSIELEE